MSCNCARGSSVAAFARRLNGWVIERVGIPTDGVADLVLVEVVGCSVNVCEGARATAGTHKRLSQPSALERMTGVRR